MSKSKQKNIKVEPAPVPDDEADFWRFAAAEWPKLRKSMLKSWKKAGFPGAAQIGEREPNDIVMHDAPLKDGYGSAVLGTRKGHEFIDLKVTLPRSVAYALTVAWGHYMDHQCPEGSEFVDEWVGQTVMRMLGGYWANNPPRDGEFDGFGH